MSLPKSIVKLSERMASLPGIGPKLSYRIALFLAVGHKNLATGLSNELNDIVANITLCATCFNVCDSEVCEICNDDKRDKSKLMVVENSLDLYAIESTDEFKGVYHVLNGVISPVNGIGPEDLTIQALTVRLGREPFTEVIFALNPTLEGDSTTLYIKDIIDKEYKNIKFTRLAKGIPSGSSIEFMSGQTLKDSFRSRDSF